MGNSCLKAYHETEERYARMEILFNTIDERKRICNCVSELIKNEKLYPSTTIMQHKGKESGEYIIEFHDDYDKLSGDFFEKVLNKLNIHECELG